MDIKPEDYFKIVRNDKRVVVIVTTEFCERRLNCTPKCAMFDAKVHPDNIRWVVDEDANSKLELHIYYGIDKWNVEMTFVSKINLEKLDQEISDMSDSQLDGYGPCRDD